MADHRFSKREYAISCMFTLLFSMLVSASFFDIATCPYNSQGGAALHSEKKSPPTSIFSDDFSLVPCHTLDLVVWTYIGLLVCFLVYKWFMYKAEGYHYFMIDYCYFHNASLCALIVSILVRVEWRPWYFWYLPSTFDIVPVATAVGSLSAEKLSATTFLFFVILAGTFGPILGAILMWHNALLFHSFDKMISCYLHLAPAVVQGLLMHSALSSVRLRPTSKLRDYLKSDVSFSTLLLMHTAMFVVWQIFYHTIHEIRLYQRKRKYNATVRNIEAVAPNVERALYLTMVCRTTAYTWMMEHPPLGKNGVLYRLVTLFGVSRFPSTVMFAVAQWIIHFTFFCLGFVPIYLAFITYSSAAPLLVYTCLYVLLCVYNAAAVNKSWIGKLTKGASEASALRKELDDCKRQLEAAKKSNLNPIPFESHRSGLSNGHILSEVPLRRRCSLESLLLYSSSAKRNMFCYFLCVYVHVCVSHRLTLSPC